ncbi:MAG: twin-arginine translocase subunit TatB [Candidatus Competibacteraceae bacterium]|nr:twin-arginine translocase subunit TatB [Candidatus Competibacteraceae bacterium]
MFEMGFWELVLVAVVALIVVGPEKLPGVARTAGLWVGKARRMVADVKAEVDRELQLEELKQSFRQQADLGGLKDFSQKMKSLERDIQAEFNDPGPPPGWRPGSAIEPPLEATPSSAPAAVAASLPPVDLAKNDPKRVGPPPAVLSRPSAPPADPNP